MVTMRGIGWRVLAPPSIAMPRVLAFFTTLTKVAVGSGTGVCWEGSEILRSKFSLDQSFSQSSVFRSTPDKRENDNM